MSVLFPVFSAIGVEWTCDLILLLLRSYAKPNPCYFSPIYSSFAVVHFSLIWWLTPGQFASIAYYERR